MSVYYGTHLLMISCIDIIFSIIYCATIGRPLNNVTAATLDAQKRQRLNQIFNNQMMGQLIFKEALGTHARVQVMS